MDLKEFLKPEWKKFILPIIFIIFFFVLINSFYSLGSFMDKIGCDYASLSAELKTEVEQNDTQAINETLNKMTELVTPYLPILNGNESKNILPIFNFIKAIDPILPVPCEFSYGNSNCEFYMSEETYNCFVNPKEELYWSFIFLESEEIQYKKVSSISLGLNVLLLFIEGYLISSIIMIILYLILCYYREIRVSSISIKIKRKR